MIKENYIDKIELILNTSGKYITNKEKDMILDYVNYFKNKNNVIEDKNIELVQENERLNNIIKEVRNQLSYLETYSSKEDVFEDMKRRLDRIEKIIGSDKE